MASSLLPQHCLTQLPKTLLLGDPSRLSPLLSSPSPILHMMPGLNPTYLSNLALSFLAMIFTIGIKSVLELAQTINLQASCQWSLPILLFLPLPRASFLPFTDK